MNKKRKLLLSAAAVLLLVAAAFLIFGGNDSAQTGVELLKNGDFSRLNSNAMPEDWYADAYIYTPGFTDYSAEDGVITIVNHELNDARFAQRVDVDPESLYCFSGYVRAEATEGLGANLSVEGVYVFSDSFYDTNGEWQEVRLYGRTDKKQTSVTLYARLGGYSGEALGKASFRDLSLTKVDSVPLGYSAQNWYQAAAVYEEADDGMGASACRADTRSMQRLCHAWPSSCASVLTSEKLPTKLVMMRLSFLS